MKEKKGEIFQEVTFSAGWHCKVLAIIFGLLAAAYVLVRIFI